MCRGSERCMCLIQAQSQLHSFSPPLPCFMCSHLSVLLGIIFVWHVFCSQGCRVSSALPLTLISDWSLKPRPLFLFLCVICLSWCHSWPWFKFRSGFHVKMLNTTKEECQRKSCRASGCMRQLWVVRLNPDCKYHSKSPAASVPERRCFIYSATSFVSLYSEIFQLFMYFSWLFVFRLCHCVVSCPFVDFSSFQTCFVCFPCASRLSPPPSSATVPFNRLCACSSCDFVIWLLHGADDVVFAGQQKVNVLFV